jgi:hypothetical protein
VKIGTALLFGARKNRTAETDDKYVEGRTPGVYHMPPKAAEKAQASAEQSAPKSDAAAAPSSQTTANQAKGAHLSVAPAPANGSAS